MPSVDDIALFFSQNGQLAKVWVSHGVYADPANKIALDPAWKYAAFTQPPVAGGTAPFYVANLSLLLDPGTAPSPVPEKEEGAGTASGGATTKVPAAGDLVVVPWDDPNNAYLVPLARYTGCPPISDSDASDLSFMAISEGVVVANLPKTEITGVTCYLLNLLALKTSAPHPGTTKSDAAAGGIAKQERGRTPRPSPRG